MVILPAEWAEEFGAFSAANPRPCPVIDRSAPGAVGFPSAGPDADIRTDVPRYRVFVDAPVHVGDPSVIGIADLDRPDFGDPVAREHGDVPSSGRAV